MIIVDKGKKQTRYNPFLTVIQNVGTKGEERK